jgi:Leucine-rich repeat (LRR) protein
LTAENPLLRLPAAEDNAAMEAKRKRRWFQFSLRTLLIVTLVVAIPCAWVGRKIERKRRERAAVALIENLGGHVVYNYQTDGTREPFGPAWLRELLGKDFFSEVDRIRLMSVTDDVLQQLKQFGELRSLLLDGSGITDPGLEHLEGLTHLSDLNLSRTAITDAGLAHLAGLADLERLDISESHITGAGVDSLKGLPHLQMLELHQTQITDATLTSLVEFPELRHLYLSRNQITDANLASLKKMTRLRFLYLAETNVTAAGIADLEKSLPDCLIRH